MRARLVLYAVVTALAMTTLYGSSYQQYRFFTLADPGGAVDAVEYVKIARGDPGVDLTGPHFHRWLTPAAARLMLSLTDRYTGGQELSVKLAFFLVNFVFSTTAAILLFALLQRIGFSCLSSLIGVGVFASSRVTVLATATPMADAAFYCAVAAVLYLAVARKTTALVFLLPVLALSKETMLPFLLLPALTDLRRSRAYWGSLVAAVTAMLASNRLVDAIYQADGPSPVDTVSEHLGQVVLSLRDLTTLGGIHDFQAAFWLVLPLAMIGAWVNARHRRYSIPAPVIATIPLALVLALLSGNLGRMFFAAFAGVIAYALVAIEHVIRLSDEGLDRPPASPRN